jgi:ABC-type dipeptide/oligopeptide/nickel transport system permease component
MGKFMIRRTLYALVTLFILSLTIFTVVRLTGDPVTLLAEPGARAEDLDRVRTDWGLDRPWPVQYLAFAKNVFTGELGKSFNYQIPVSTLYFQRLPNSLELALAATLIAFFIGIPAGIISAVCVNSGWDSFGKALCCTDQQPGAVSPSSDILREANVLRPAKLEHPVQRGDSDCHLGRLPAPGP